MPAFAADEAAPGEIRLGVASYSFREFQRHMAIEGTVKCGVHYINLKDMHLPFDSTPADFTKCRRDLEKARLTLEGGGNIPLDKADEADIRRKFEYAKAAGMPLMVCAPTKESLPIAEKMVKEYNIKMAIHNHGPEDKHFPTPQSVLAAVKDLDPRCGLCIDCGHTARTGVDVVESIHEAGPRLYSMHIKDLANFQDKASQVPVGDGIMPIPRIFQMLKRISYKGCVMLEYEIEATDPLPGMIKSFAYMRGVLVGMKAHNA